MPTGRSERPAIRPGKDRVRALEITDRGQRQRLVVKAEGFQAIDLGDFVESSRRLGHLAKAEKLCVRYLGQVLPLAYMAPDLVEQIVDGRQPQALSLGALIARPFPMDWDQQRKLFMAIGAVG